MPRYFFNIFDGVDLRDHEGTELSNWKEAQREAIRFAGSVIADNARRAKLGEDWTMEVTDESGLILFRLDFHISGAAATMGSSEPTEV